MKVLFPQCMDCSFGVECYEEGFERCHKIEAAGVGMGIQVKQKDNAYLRNIPFGVFMTLKHIVARANDPNYIEPEVKDFKFPRVDFVNRLATETSMSQEESAIFVSEISLHWNINEAIKYYEEHGLYDLKLHLYSKKASNGGIGCECLNL